MTDIDDDLTDDDIDRLDLTTCKVVRRGPRLDRKLPLAFLRERRDLTQAQVAKKAKMAQSDVSRAEQRSDCLVSTLERYAKALGGALRLVIDVDGHAYSIGLATKPRRPRRRSPRSTPRRTTP